MRIENFHRAATVARLTGYLKGMLPHDVRLSKQVKDDLQKLVTECRQAHELDVEQPDDNPPATRALANVIGLSPRGAA